MRILHANKRKLYNFWIRECITSKNVKIMAMPIPRNKKRKIYYVDELMVLVTLLTASIRGAPILKLR